jgi:hypothetical protein
MNDALNQLQPYPFEKLRALLAGAQPPSDKPAIALSIGEPKHRSPAFVAEALSANLEKLAVYPSTLGIAELREAIANWCNQRFNLPAGTLDPARHVLPVNGTREALFAFTQTVVQRGVDGQPQPVLPDLRRRSPARRRPAALPGMPGTARFQPGFRCGVGRCMATLPDPLPLLARQPDRRADSAGHPEATDPVGR